MKKLVTLSFLFSVLVGWLNGGVVRFGEIVGKPDGVEEMDWVEVGTPVVLFSVATDMTNE